MTKGSEYPGFLCKGAVRQGCPLSPLLFAAIVDLLLRMWHHRVPQGDFKAFADDIGALIEDIFKDIDTLCRTFKEFTEVSAPDLNLGKTLCIPLRPEGKEEFHSYL